MFCSQIPVFSCKSPVSLLYVESSENKFVSRNIAKRFRSSNYFFNTGHKLPDQMQKPAEKL